MVQKKHESVTPQQRDSNLFDEISEKIKKLGSEDMKLFETIASISNKHCGVGRCKLKILEETFDMFLESMLMGKDFKAAFYAADKIIPQTFAELQSYKKMKKFQKHEKYPDEKVRNFIDVNILTMQSEEEYNNYLLNKMPAIRKTKEEMKEGIKTLFAGKEIIYRALFRNEIS